MNITSELEKALERLKTLDAKKLEELINKNRDELRERRWEEEKAEAKAMETLKGTFITSPHWRIVSVNPMYNLDNNLYSHNFSVIIDYVFNTKPNRRKYFPLVLGAKPDLFYF
jgi:hypothetical protein